MCGSPIPKFVKRRTNLNLIYYSISIIFDFNILYDFDHNILQLTTYGETRDEALQTMTKALDSYVIRGND